MKYECDIIADLLPLYKDGACSGSSKQVVEEHLAECPKCAKMFEMMQDSSIDDEITREKDEVIDKQAKFFKRKSALAGTIVGGIFAIPILICLIVDIATGSGLSWFFIVLSAMLIPTSLFVVPLMSSRNKMFNTMVSFTASVILLLGVCRIINGGNWFLVAASAVLFGLTVCFSPFIVCRRPVNKLLKNFKGLTAMAACTITYIIMMVCIGIVTDAPNYFAYALGISAPCLAIIWILFLIIRYLHVNGFLKAAISIGIISIFSVFANSIIASIVIRTEATNGVVVYTDSSMFTLVIGLGIAAVLLVIGILVKIFGGKKNEEV